MLNQYSCFLDKKNPGTKDNGKKVCGLISRRQAILASGMQGMHGMQGMQHGKKDNAWVLKTFNNRFDPAINQPSHVLESIQTLNR